MMCYDQVNLPNLAGAETLNRRRCLIEAAHSGHPESPNYEAAEEFMGVGEALDGTLLDPALVSYVAKRQSSKAEVYKQSRMMREEKEAARKAATNRKHHAKDDGPG